MLKIFVLYMNKIGKDIGAKSSIFANPHGLPNINNVSNA
jgi:D-alanyl-D-alanine carboxypeptidase